jgi:membrane protease YdiL (CAAX protease family)
VGFGWGLLVTALLFGVFRVLNLPELYAGRLDPAWGAGVAAGAWGLFFGYLREWSGSIVAPALVHGVPQGIATAVLG